MFKSSIRVLIPTIIVCTTFLVTIVLELLKVHISLPFSVVLLGIMAYLAFIHYLEDKNYQKSVIQSVENSKKELVDIINSQTENFANVIRQRDEIVSSKIAEIESRIGKQEIATMAKPRIEKFPF